MLMTFTLFPGKPSIVKTITIDNFKDSENVTTTALNNAYLAVMNLTLSNFTAQSTNETFTSSSNNTSNVSILSTTTNSNHNNNASQRHSGRSNAFEIPIWLILCYCAILLCAIVGNLLVISTLVQNRRMRTITNVFLLNLAISDILLGVLCMPVTLVGTLLRHFIFGEFFCKLIQFSQAASVAVSSWTLVAISCERYYAICHPLRSRRWQTRSHAYKIIAFIWFGSMLCMLPIALFSQLMPTNRQGLRKCRENWPHLSLPYERFYNIFLDLVLLVLPLLALSVAYILITRTLYMGMRIERTMIFGGKHEDLNSHAEQKSNSGDLLEKSLYLTTTPLTMNTPSSSRLKLNLSLRNHGGTLNNTAAYKNINCIESSKQKENWVSIGKETNGFGQQEQQYHQNIQPSGQRFNQSHNFQNYHQQQQIKFRPSEQKQHQNHHKNCSEHQQRQESQQQPCCEPFSRLCCKRLNNPSTNANNTRQHLYCMRFATLKTTQMDKDGNAMNNFCTGDYCDGVDSGSTAPINVNCNNLSATPAVMTLSSSPTASSSTTTSTMYRYQLQQQPHNHPLQHNHLRCYCVPRSNNKTDAKKVLNSKRSLKVTKSVLRRNNIAKNLESKKRVVKMLFVLVLEFFICWTPLYVINTIAMYIGSAIYEYIDYTSISVLQLLAYSSSCCNPITYCFMNANFRRAFLDTFKGIHWCGKRLQRKRSTAQNSGNLCLAGSIRVNSCTVQTVIDSPRL